MKSQVLFFAFAAVSSAAAMETTPKDDKTTIVTTDTIKADAIKPKYDYCYWDGTAPFCAGSCPSSYTEELRSSSGDGAQCATGIKVYCCK